MSFMTFFVTPADFPVLVGAFVAIILSIVFTARATAGTRANFWGAAFLFVSSIRIFLKYLNHSGMIIEFPHLARIQYPLGLVTPVLIYLYVLHLLGWARRPSWKVGLHFLPAIAVALYLGPYFLASGAEKVAWMTTSGGMPQQIPTWYRWAGLPYSALYLVMAEVVRRRFLKNQGGKELSGSGKALVAWIQLLLIGGGIFLVTAVVMRLAGGIVDLNYFLFQVFSILMILACVKLLLLPSPVFSGTASASKYAKSSLTDKKRQQHAEQLTRLLKERELFRRNDLRSADLAAEIGVPEYVLSQVMNEEFGQTFHDLIREYRVRAVQAHLTDPAYSHYTMEAIGSEVGFRARASFYSAFRELTGLTPTEFRKAHLSGDN